MMSRKKVRRTFAASGAAVISMAMFGPQTWSAFSSEVTHAGTATAGTVVLSDNGEFQGSDLWRVQNMRPGASQSVCLAVTYTGSLPANLGIHMVSTPNTGGPGELASMVNLTIERGTGTPSGPNDCGGFSAEATIYNDKLSNHGTSWASRTVVGPGTWTNGTSKVLRFTVQLSASADDSFQSKSVGTTVIVESQNS